MSETKMTAWRGLAGERPVWERLDFELDEFADRHRRVREAMDERGIDLLLCIDPKHLNYLIGFRGKCYQEFQCLFFPLEEAPLTFLVRDAEVFEMSDLTLADDVRGWGGREPGDPIDLFRRVIGEKGYRSRRIGLEVPYYYLSAHDYLKIRDCLGESFALDATSLVESLKLAKSAAEIAMIRRAAAIADLAMQASVDAIAEGASELEVAAETYRALLANGSDSPASPANFVSGERTCYGHGAPSERRIGRGDFMHIEYGAAFHRYTCTIGRNLCLGTPTPRQQEVHDLTRAACDALIAAVKPGVSTEIPHLEAKRVIAEAGLDHARIHTSGYGVAPGFPPSWGESLHFHGGYPYVPGELREGMVLSVEPPVMLHRERLGARLIDDVLVTAEGCEILSRYPRELIVID